jgi:hypothetical protein
VTAIYALRNAWMSARRVIVRENTSNGLVAAWYTYVNVEDSDFLANPSHGIYASTFSRIDCTSCILGQNNLGNGYGARALRWSQLVLQSVSARYNTIDGVLVSNMSEATIADGGGTPSTLSNNTRYGVYTHTQSYTAINNTVLNNNGNHGMRALYNSGIVLNSGTTGTGNAGWGSHASWLSFINYANVNNVSGTSGGTFIDSASLSFGQ